MKVLACSTLALASLSLAVPRGRRGSWKRRNNGPQLRPMINDPLSSVEEFFSAEEIAAAASGQSYKCKSPTYVSRCRMMIVGSFKYTFNAETNSCDSFIWNNRAWCNGYNTDNYFDTRKECENSCLVPAPIENETENEAEAGNNDLADDTAGLSMDELLNMPPVNAKSVFSSSNRFADLINQYKQSLRRQQKSADSSKCDAPMARISMCRGFFSAIWTFNKETGECDSFHPGGCEEPTQNWFTSEADCRSTCM